LGVTVLFLSAVVNERKHTEGALRTEMAFADMVIDGVPGAFYVLDQSGRMVRWNRFLEEINRLSSEELTRMDSVKNIHTGDRERLFVKIREALETGQSHTEGRILTKSGVRYSLFTGRRIKVEGVPHVVGSGMDITDHKLLETQLVEQQRNLETIIENRQPS
jgi:PAS domain S-box-containing protein